MNILKSIGSEFIKVKRTSVLYLCFVIAAVMPLFTLSEYLMGSELNPAHPDPWGSFFMEAQQGISIMLLPLFIILMCTLLPQIEYKNNTWKQVLASPQPFSNIFISKFLIIQLSIITFLLVNLLLMILAGISANLFNPELPFLDSKIAIWEILKTTSITYVSALGISAIQFWVGMRFKSFITPIAIGLGLWILGCMLVFEIHWLNADLFPFSYPLLSIFPKYAPILTTILWSSVGYFFLISFLAFVDLKFRKRII